MTAEWHETNSEASELLKMQVAEASERMARDRQARQEMMDRIEKMYEGPIPELTQEQIESIQRANARQVHAEWVEAGRPGAPCAVQYKADGEWQWLVGPGLFVERFQDARYAEACLFTNGKTEWRTVPWHEVPEADRRHHNPKPLRVRFELAPGFGLSWLSLLACCAELRGGVIDTKGCGLDGD